MRGQKERRGKGEGKVDGGQRFSNWLTSLDDCELMPRLVGFVPWSESPLDQGRLREEHLGMRLENMGSVAFFGSLFLTIFVALDTGKICHYTPGALFIFNRTSIQ